MYTTVNTALSRFLLSIILREPNINFPLNSVVILFHIDSLDLQSAHLYIERETYIYIYIYIYI